MGKRRIRLLKQIKSDAQIIGIDSNTERGEQVKKELEIDVYNDLDKVLSDSKIDVAIISTSPLSHGKLIKKCLLAGVNVFSEINLVADMYYENIELSRKQNKVLFLSSTFLYREEIRYIISKINNRKENYNYIYHTGQYLPDWHPWETYRDFFVGDIRTNGCRELFAIELPWIITAFGEIENITVLSGKNTLLNIDYHDNYFVLINHRSGNKGVLAVDVLSRKAVRNLEVFSENLYISWGGDANSLKEYDVERKTERSIKLYEVVERLDGYSSFVVENAYKLELEEFFQLVQEGKQPLYDFEKDLETLKWIDRIEGESK